jgi:hypothetical protein
MFWFIFVEIKGYFSSIFANLFRYIIYFPLITLLIFNKEEMSFI